MHSITDINILLANLYFEHFFALVSSLVITSSPIFPSICWGEDYKEINDLLQLIINLLKNLATISDGMYCTNYYTHSKDVSPIIKLEFCDGKLLRHFNNTMWSEIYIRLVVLAISNLVATPTNRNIWNVAGDLGCSKYRYYSGAKTKSVRLHTPIKKLLTTSISQSK